MDKPQTIADHPGKYKALLLMLIFISLGSQLFMLFQSPYPNGLDGAFYSLEAKSFYERGHLENPSLGPMYYICGLLIYPCGDAFIAVKWASALVMALLLPAFYMFIRRWFNKEWSLWGTLLLAISPSLRLMSINYLNNLFGLVCFFIFASVLLDKRAYKPWAFWGILPISGLLATISHKTTAVYTLALIGLFLLENLLGTSKHKIRMFLGIFLPLSAMGLYLILTQGSRFSGDLHWKPSIALFSASFRQQLPLAVLCEMSLLMVSAYEAAFLWLKDLGRFSFYSLAPLLVYFPFWKLNQLDMGYRLLLCATPLGILSLIYLMDQLQIKLPKTNWIFYILILVIPLGILVYNPKKDPPYGYYSEVVQQIELPEESLLIAHLGLNHIYSYYNQYKDALNYLPNFPVSEQNLWRLAYGASYNSLAGLYPRAVKEGYIKYIDRHYLLIREDYWQRYLKEEDSNIGDSLVNWYNPQETRPEYIRKISSPQ
jgi:hypothetical protein